MTVKRLYWTCQVLGWSAYSASGALAAISQVGPRPDVIVGYGLFFLYSIALTDLFRREILRRRWLTLPLGRVALRLLAGAATVGTIQTILVLVVSVALQPRSELLSNPNYALGLWAGVIGVTIVWTILYVALTATRRSREKEVHMQLAIREAELRALEAQVNPHFLFNCLNSIRALVIENPAQAQDMITRFANILRYNLHRDLNHTVPLASEVEVVSDYLALEAIRLEDRLRVQVEIDSAARQAAVPPMILQTLVENALKHGIAPRPSGGHLTIRASLRDEWLVLEVENTGQLGAPRAEGAQVGLANTRERLRILYGPRATLRLENRDAASVAATVLIPRTA